MASALAAGSSIVFRRNFQRPTGLGSESVAALEIALLEPLILYVALNGKACSPQRRSDVVFEVPLSADQLQPINDLEITVQAPAGASTVEHPQFGQNYLARVELILS
ncbi:MAG: hypothetical protein ACTHK7_13020 [Aureliella sp.]